MKYKQIRRALDGLFAYDAGSVDSGIKDEALRQKVRDHFAALTSDQRRALLARLTVDLWLTPEAVAHGYTLEDVSEWIEWIEEQLGGPGALT